MRVQTFVLYLERALKAIRQQRLYAMTEEEGHRHLKVTYFMGFNPISIMPLAICMTSSIPQYSQLVMASRKAEKETPRSSVSEVGAKSTVVRADTDSSVKRG